MTTKRKPTARVTHTGRGIIGALRETFLFTIQKRDSDTWEVLYPDGSLVDIYASKTEAKRVRDTMQARQD